MTDAKKTVKQALSLALVVVFIVATIFGLNVPYGLGDVITPNEDVMADDLVADENTDKESTTTTDEADQPTNETEEPTEEVEDEHPQDTAPTEDLPVEDAETSDEVDVADQPEENNNATEGDVENA